MKLKVKTKLRNEKDELQVDDVSPLFSTINEGIENEDINVTKKLYRHVFKLNALRYNGWYELINKEYISTRSTKYLDGTMTSMQAYLRPLWDNLFAGLTLKTEKTYQNPKYETIGKVINITSPYGFTFNNLALLKYIGRDFTLEGRDESVDCTLDTSTPTGVIYRLVEEVEEV